MSEGITREEASAIIVRGDGIDYEERRFISAVLEEVGKRRGITSEQLVEISGPQILDRGVLNWAWVQALLSALDRHVPYASGATIALFTHDVYQYLKNSSVREAIDEGVAAAFDQSVEAVVVGHSLGTVVAYNLLRMQGHLTNWKVPLFVTLGSPLGVREIQRTLRAFAPVRCPQCVSDWFNALDARDVVALYELTAQSFPLNPASPAINDYAGVRNTTDNRHGIAGYLNDEVVAKRIYQALEVAS